MTNHFEIKEDGSVDTSLNGHYSLMVVEREEKEYPDSLVKRYEVINNYTNVCEGRIANLHMALLIMNEFDRRLQDILENGLSLPEDETTGIPVDMNLGETHH